MARTLSLKIGDKEVKIKAITPRIMFELAKKGVPVGALQDLKTGFINYDAFIAILNECLECEDKDAVIEKILDDWHLFIEVQNAIFSELMEATERPKFRRKSRK